MTIEQTLQEAIEAHKAGNLQDAEMGYRAVLETLPKHPDANHNLGLIAVALNKPEAAVPLFKTALESAPNQGRFWISYVEVLIKNKQFDSAKDVLEQGKKRGLAGEKVDTLEIQLNEIGINLNGQEIKRNNLFLAIEFRETGRYQEAQMWLNNFVEIESNNAEAWSLLSQIYMLNKKDAEAEKALSNAISINANLPSIYRNHARLFLKKSQPAEALIKAQCGYDLSINDPESWIVLASCLGANQRDQEALSLIERALQARPNYAEAFANRAIIRLRTKNIVGAIEDVEMAVSLKPHLTQLWVLLGSLRYQSKNLSGAIEALKRVHEIEPTNVSHMIDMGEFLRQDKRVSEAIAILEEAIKLEPENSNAWINLGAALHQDEKIDRAKAAFEQALAINPRSTEILVNLGAIANNTTDLESARKYFKRAIELKPDFAEAHYHLGNALNDSGIFEEAEASFRYALTLKPDMVEAYYNLGNIQQKLGKLEDAEVSFRKTIALKPDLADFHSNLGNILQELGKLEDAEVSFRKAIEIKPDYAEAHSNLGVTLQELGKLKQSEVSLRKAIEIKPSLADAHYNLGNTLHKLGALEDAVTSYKKAIVLKPDFAGAYSNLGNVLQELGKVEDAVTIYKKAIVIKPDFTVGFYNLGLLLYAKKQYDQAAELLNLITFKDSQSYLLGCLYYQKKQVQFYELLNSLTSQGVMDPIIGSFSCRAEVRDGLIKSNSFCSDPFKYVFKTDLSEHYDFLNIFVKPITTILNDDKRYSRPQDLLTNGYQTAGNVFTLERDLTDEIEKIIHSEVEKYRIYFEDSEEGFLKKWPSEYSINGWLISMKSGGKLSPHMHEKGWISGSIYINVPLKSNPDSGNLVVCIDGEDHLAVGKIPREISIDVTTGSLCLFPSSLLHYTIPFESEEERIVLAFDVVPK